jgi:hypothetical protein
MEVPSELRLHLAQAGWSDDRSFDTGEYKRAIIAAGLPLHRVVVDFLRRFGGLTARSRGF